MFNIYKILSIRYLILIVKYYRFKLNVNDVSEHLSKPQIFNDMKYDDITIKQHSERNV